ncbi:serine hydrolase [Caballeronia sp. SBC2]|uniref:serine hydrolase domain-containing protein n=1 Tax=Caballeronia sp. SBC2 TaxID=2705547 RepID=UPI0013E1FD18|nr:serine hydrolase domain-containing protein [Caballeronia sp. SBC2]QIE29820.1 Putative D-alanyl-D-alanine carboxypeptidase [Caballeronia sp. SBC2]
MRSLNGVISIIVSAIAVACPVDGTAQVAVAPTSNNSTDASDSLAASVATLKNQFRLGKVWLRYESDNREALDVTIGGESSDLLHIGSLSKSITAEAIALLIQNKQLDLESKLGDVLSSYFKQHGKSLDPSLENISILQLLTHTAGLKTNHTSDPINGIDNSIAFKALPRNATPLDYLFSANANSSVGSGQFVYSNISYLLLGLVVESVSGLSYQEYCRKNLFSPLGITSPKISTLYIRVGPFAGWEMTMADFLKLWKVFDQNDPSILTRETLKATLLGQLGPAQGKNNVHYTLGVYVRQSDDGSSYVLSHNGITDFYQRDDQYYSFAESRVPGGRWLLVTSPPPDGDSKRDLPPAFRQMIAHYEHSRN